MKFKIWDRVRVYSGASHFDGFIQHIWATGSLEVVFDSPKAVTDVRFHPKQCRRLIKKPILRRIYVPNRDKNCIAEFHFRSKNHLNDYLELEPVAKSLKCTEFIEVRKKK